MQLVKFGTVYPNVFNPTKLLEGYTSLIWTERFQALGDFQLKTFLVEETKALLPEGMFVSHLETEEVMIVETHEVNMVGEGADAYEELTVKGRSASLIFDHRYIDADYQKKRRMRRKYTATAAIACIMYNAVNNASGGDVTRGDDDPETNGVQNHYWANAKDKLANVAISEDVADEGETRWWQLEQGMVLPQILSMMVDADLGLRCLRPVLPNNTRIVDVETNLGNRGLVTRTNVSNLTDLRFEIYSGVDRSDTVKFSQLQGHIDSPVYLESTENYKNAVEMMSGTVSISDVTLPNETFLTGWRRRAMSYDAGSPELPPEPEKPAELGNNATSAQRTAYRKAIDTYWTKKGKWDNKRDRIVDDFREEQTKRAKRELKAARRVDMFSGDISELSPYVYKTHYNLGDLVTLDGTNKSAKMLVVEYVRTEDENGDRGIPGLVAP